MSERKTLIFTLIFSAVLTLSAAAQPELPCGMYLTSAKIYLGQKPPDLESALQNLLSSPEKCRKTGEIDFMIGGIYADKNEYEKMVEFFNIALKKDPSYSKKIKDIKESKWSEVWKRGIESLEKAQNWSSKITAVRDSISLDQKNNKKWMARLDTLISEEKSEHQQALKFFETGILIDSSRYEAFLNAGIEALNLNDQAKAALLFEKVYKIAPENLNVKVGYATILLDQQKFSEAAKIYEEILKLDPKNKEALINLAMCYTRLGDNLKSLAIYDTAIALGLGDKDLYFNRGLLKLTQAQEMTKKIIQVRDSMLAKPNDKTLVDKSNQLIAEQKKIFGSAEPDFKKVVEMDSTDGEGWFQLGFVEWQLEKPAEARNALERVTKQYPESKESWELLALVYTKLGMKKEAESAALKAKSP